jgi:hypothetical protein
MPKGILLRFSATPFVMSTIVGAFQVKYFVFFAN